MVMRIELKRSLLSVIKAYKADVGTDFKDKLLNGGVDYAELERLELELQGELAMYDITSVHKDDLLSKGFCVSEIDEESMESLASKMASDYCEQLFWTSMSIIAEDGLEMPKIETILDSVGSILADVYHSDSVTSMTKEDFLKYKEDITGIKSNVENIEPIDIEKVLFAKGKIGLELKSYNDQYWFEEYRKKMSIVSKFIQDWNNYINP